jgi:hypothetical protein
MAQSSQYQRLIEKLDSFIRRYYTNLVIRGAILSAVYVLAFFLAINLMEYYFFLSSALRKILFYGFLISSAAFTTRFLLLPLLHYYRLGKIISYEQAAQIIGTHFNEVKDKLLNILQLHGTATGAEGSGLLLAAIDQKATELKPVDFSFAIDLAKNRKYLRYLAPPFLLLLFIIIAAPNIIKEGTSRLYHNGTYYEKQAPFQFVIKNKELKALQYDNYTLEVKMEGASVPAEVFIESGKNIFKLKKKDASTFTYDFLNLQKSEGFQLSANGFHSKEYTLNVVAKPLVAGFEVRCEYPPYTGKKNEIIKNTGDLVVPAGTRLTWKFSTQNADGLVFITGDSAYQVKRSGEAEFSFSKTFLQSAEYALKVSNSNVKDGDSVSYSLNVVPDLYPVIAVNEQRDSATQKYFYYSGEVSDDYGLRNLTFNYQITHVDSATPNASKSITVPIAGGLSSRFSYYWSLTDFNIRPGDKMSYYFEVWDNDGIHGSKSAKSNMMAFEMPSVNELNKEITKDNKELKDEMKETMVKAEDLKNNLKGMQDKLQEKKSLSWEDKKNLSENIDKQKELQKQMEDIKNKMDQNFEKQNEFKEINPEIAQKEKRLQDLFEQVMNKDMKELYDKLQKMLEELQKKDALDKMQDMAANNEKLEKELDRMLELFKKLEFAQKLQETADKLEKMGEKQDQLAQQTEKKQDAKDNKENSKDNNKDNKDSKDNKDDKDNKDNKNSQDNKDAKDNKEAKNANDKKTQDDLQKQQDKLSNDLQDAQKDVEDLKKLNEETKSQQDFNAPEKDMNSASKEMDQASKDMQSSQDSKASKSQKSAASNMKDAAQKMKDMKMKMEQEQNDEDMQAIRQLLKNILQLSFDEEKLMGDVKATNINTPKFVDLMHEQARIRENSKMVEDSLYALAKRQDQISSFVTKQITDVDKYITKGIADMEDRNTARAMNNEQYVMTGYNNLALMLSETMKEMQEQQSESQDQTPSQGQKMCKKCKKPGNGLPNLSKMQKQLNDKISQAAEMLKKQGQGQMQDQNMSKEFAEMAQMQAQIRKELEKINQQENKDGKNSLGDLGQMASQMEETEKQLVNKQLTTEMLKRQQQIMSRLLEAENAERERDQKQEREAQSAKELERKIPPSIEAYLKAKQSEVDLYKTVPPSLKPYYKSLAEKYFRSLTVPQ